MRRRGCYNAAGSQETGRLMRILNSVLGDASGGRWAVVCDYSRALQAQGHTVTLLLNRRHPPDLNRLPTGIAVEFIRSSGHYDYLAALLARKKLGQPPALAIAHCSRSVALLKRALPETPLIAVSHSNKVERLLPADVHLALSGSIRAQFERAGTGKPCFVVPNMIAISAAARPQKRPRHEPLCIGALGRFDPVKGFDVYIDALHKLQDSGHSFSALLAGAGSEREALQQRAAALGLERQLVFCDWVGDVDAFLEKLDILCVPARSDAFGLTPLEAARAGIPMVLSRAAGHLEMFSHNEQALFADVDDAGQMANELSRLMAQAALAERLRQAAFNHVLETFSEQLVTAKLVDIIEYTVNNSSHLK